MQPADRSASLSDAARGSDTNFNGKNPRWRVPLDPRSPLLGRIGMLETRLARSQSEIRQAQALRYEVFRTAQSSPTGRLFWRDKDRWDRACDHLLVLDQKPGPPDCDPPESGRVVGACRLLTAEHARLAGLPFYSAGEFDIEPLLARHRSLNFMELGRSCVLPSWRARRAIELLWGGIWALVRKRRVDVMFGCASLEGVDPDRHAEALSFLVHHAAANADWQAVARRGRAVRMDRIAASEIDTRRAIRALPPLIKGYLRLGASFGSQAAVDRRFGSIDVLVILPVKAINPRYVAWYGAKPLGLPEAATPNWR